MLSTRARTLPAKTAVMPMLAVALVMSVSQTAGAAQVRNDEGKLSLGLLSVTKGEGFSDKQINTIEEVLLTAFEATGRFKVIGRTDIAALMGLETKKEAVGCSEDTACVAQIAGALGVDLVATADVGRLGSTTILTLKVIVVRTAAALTRVRRTVKTNDELVGAADSMAAEIAGAVDAEWGDAGRPQAPPAAPPPPPPEAAMGPPEPPAPPRPAATVAPAGIPGTLHLQLGARMKSTYTVAVTIAGRSLKCPIPLSPTNGCDLSPVTTGEAHFTLFEGDSIAKEGTLQIARDGARMKLVLVRPGWATGVGIASIVVGAVLGAIGVADIGVAASTDNPALTSSGEYWNVVGIILVAAGIPVLLAIHSPGFVDLGSSEPIIPAP